MNNKINCSITLAAAGSQESESDQRQATIADVFAIVRQILSEATIYVLESDITDAQHSTQNTLQQTFF